MADSLPETIGRHFHPELVCATPVISYYLDNEATRRANRLFTQLTAVTVLSIIGTVTAGFFGMTLFEFNGSVALEDRCLHLAIGAAVLSALLAVSVIHSRLHSETVDILANGRKPMHRHPGAKFRRRRRSEDWVPDSAL